jgi:hypothetical protein
MKNITLKDLIDLGVINVKKKKNKKNKKKKQKQKRQLARGYEMGGIKSDSSHMQSYSQSMPFSNTSNTQTEIQHLQRKMLEDQIKNPDKDRFQKEEPKNNLLSIEDFSKTLNPFINKLIEHDNRVGKVEKVGNQLLSDLNYGEEDFIGNYKPSKIQIISDDDINETNNKFYDLNDGNGIITDNPDNYFVNEGNSNPYQEIEVNNTPIRKSHDEDINNTPKSLFGSTQETLSKLFNINKKADENFISPQSDVIPEIIPKKEKNITPQKEKIKSPIKETNEKIPEKDVLIVLEPSEKLQNKKETAIPRFKNLLLQFNYTPNEIDKKLNELDNNMNNIRTEYQKYYALAVEHNNDIIEKNKINKKNKSKVNI